VRNMWYPDLQSTEMLRLRSTAVDLHAQLTAQKLPAGNLSVDEVVKIPEEFLFFFFWLAKLQNHPWFNWLSRITIGASAAGDLQHEYTRVRCYRIACFNHFF